MIKTTSNLFKWRRVQILSATFFCITLALLSCKKKDTTVGKDAYDPANLLNSVTKDDFALKTYTIDEDSVSSKNQLNALLGQYNDPKFGTVNASFYTQVSIQNPGPTNFDNPVVDSIVLSLQYAGYYGDAETQTFEVFEIGEDLKNDSTYYIHYNAALKDNIDLVIPGKGTILPKPSTRTVIGGDTLAPQLRIPLKLSFAQHLIDGTANYTTQDAFRSWFKGLHVKVNNPGGMANGKGGVYYFNLSGVNSKLTIYYKSAGIAKEFAYLMDGTSVDFNHLEFNRTGKPFDNVINMPVLGQKEFYAQAFTSRAVVEFPEVTNIPKNAVIHKAQLILPVSHYINDLRYPSLQLSPGTRITQGGHTIYTLQNPSAPTTTYNISYDKTLKAYVVDLRLYLQQVVSEQIANRGLFFRPVFFNSTVERIIFNGPESINKKKPKLVVTYTTY